MAIRVLTDAYFSFGGVDLSDHVRSITPSRSAESLDATAMGNDTRIHRGGLFDWGFEVELYTDEAASSVNQTLYPLIGTTGTLVYRPDKSEGVGTTNPNYTGTALLVDFPPFGGAVGEMAMSTASFQSAGSLSRATA